MCMKILVIGEQRHLEECRQKLGEHDYTHRGDHRETEAVLNDQDVVFDFLIDAQPQCFGIYVGKKVTAFLSAVRIPLIELAKRLTAPWRARFLDLTDSQPCSTGKFWKFPF